MLYKISLLSKYINISIFISKIPFSFGNVIRYEFYKKTMLSVGKNVLFSYGTIFSHRNISIGNNVRFGPYNTIGLTDFENNILIGQFTHFLSGKNQHSFLNKDVPIYFQVGEIERINVGTDVWIGAGSIIMASVSSGNIVGAGSVVTKKFDKDNIIVGNPAKKIKER